MSKLPFWFLCFFVFTLPWQGLIFIPGLGSIARLLGFILLGVAAVYIFLKKNIKEPSLLIILMIIFVVYGLLSYFWSYFPSRTFGGFIQNAQFLAMMWLIWELCYERKDYRTLVQFFVLGLYISVFGMISAFFTQSAAGYRISGGGVGQSIFAFYLSIGISFAWFLYLTQRNNILKFINLIFIPLAVFCLVLTASRQGIFLGGIALMMIPLTFSIIPNSSKFIVSAFIFVCLIFSMAYYGQIAERLERNIERLTQTGEMIQERRLSGREAIWRAGMRRFPEQPVHGFGANTSSRILGIELERDRGRGAHSTYVAILMDGGIIGLIILFSIIIIAILPVFYADYLYRIFGLIVLGIIVVTMIVNNLETDKAFWFTLSLFMAPTYAVLNNKHIYFIIRK